MAELLLVIGRTSKQGVGANIGKESAEFQEATSYVEISEQDAVPDGLTDGEPVDLVSPFGRVQVTCRLKRGGELPAGLGFMPYGPLSSRLMGGETHGTGMPDSKGITVQVLPVGAKEGHAR